MSASLLSANLPEVLAEVRRLRRRFAPTAEAWGPCTAAVELQVQIGHLALCVLRRHGTDVSALEDPDRPLDNLGDELADVVLAALSVAVLAGTEPSPIAGPAAATHETEALLRLLVSAGALSEVALVNQQFRHCPPGALPSLPEVAAAVIGSCEDLADRWGLDLFAEFRSMIADADAFLDTHGGTDD